MSSIMRHEIKKIQKIYIGIGSNLGDRLKNISQSIGLLRQNRKLSDIKESSIYETVPVGMTEQPGFLNCVVELRTQVTAHDLLEILLNIERKLHRKRTIRFGPRTIDMDILLYGDDIIHDENLSVPHPRMHKRKFVLVGLNELAPELIHPVLKKSVLQLLKLQKR